MAERFELTELDAELRVGPRDEPSEAQVLAFVDEYGDHGLGVEKAGATAHFVLAAILVRQADLDRVREGVEAVRLREFPKGELKSSRVGGKDAKRTRMIEALAKLPWNAYVIAIDKSRVDPESGLLYGRSFRKFAFKKLYAKLIDVHESLNTKLDEHGESGFMREFVAYVERNFPPSLFRRPAFDFVNSAHEPLIQLADMIAGTVGRILDPNKETKSLGNAVDILRPHLLAVDEWPFRSLRNVPRVAAAKASDDLVANQAQRSALQYLERHERSDDPDVLLRTEAVHLLLSEFNYERAAFIQKGRLAELLGAGTAVGVSTNRLRRQIIGPLRDDGVLIASTAQGGYKLAASVEDLIGFVTVTQTVVEPSLRRIRKAREAMLMASHGEVDILTGDEFAALRRLVDQLGPVLNSAA